MANPPGAGTKFGSVNLNKAYGQGQQHGSGRTRGGGGAMVVLSRPRSSQKVGPKLSVPPPLNLPSLRKEHEKFDSLGSGGGATVGGGGSGSGSRPSSSGMGWTKPATATLTLQDKEPMDSVDGFSSVYVPPSTRSGVVGPTALEKAAVLRGEDFPSLRATLSSASGVSHKPKENLNQKEKHLGGDSLYREQKDGSRVSSLVDVNSNFKLSRGGVCNGLSENGNETRTIYGSSRAIEQGGGRQEGYFPGPLPLVKLSPRSDWADDERDTSHGLMERNKESRGFSKTEAYWDRDFDVPRVSVLLHKPAQSFDKRVLRDNDTGKVSSGEVSRLDPCVRTANKEGREGHYWRNPSFSKNDFGIQDARNERNGVGPCLNRETGKDNEYTPSPVRDNYQDDPGKRDKGYGQGGKPTWHNSAESYGGRGPEQHARDRFVSSDKYHRNRVDSVQNLVSKSSFSVGGKRLPVNDPLVSFGREKRTLPMSEKAFLEDPFTKDFGTSGFDGRDLLSVGLVVKKKKDVLKQTDFHDPIRESFEAELERVQRMQEQERQRIIEEQDRALELARREEEERLRQAREQEERQRRLEEEANEAAWQAEQERIEALMKAEEQRLAREEEKQRILLEEERRKQAAKQKLLELEQKIAMRQAEAAKGGNYNSSAVEEKMPGLVKERDTSRATDVGDWDDSERMVEKIMTSSSYDSSSLNRPLEIGSRPHFSKDISSTFVDRGKPANSWRRDVNENGSRSALHLQYQENGHNSDSPCRDSSIIRKPFRRKEYYAGAGLMSSRTYCKGGVSDSHCSKNTEIDSDFHENFVERLHDGWPRSHFHGNPFRQFPEHSYPNSESDGPYALGRSRYSVRQPRVLPPPLLASGHKAYGNGTDHPGPSAFLENEVQYNQAANRESTMPSGFDNRFCGQPEVVDTLQSTTENKDHEVETTPRCDYQSSLSVSSPPSSPTHISRDDLDESGNSEEDKSGTLSAPENESAEVSARARNENVDSSSFVESTVVVVDDDEWTTENIEQFQEHEEYDEDEDYQEGDDNIDLNQEFEDMCSEENGLSHMMDNLVLGFDEGVQVGLPNEEFERTSKDEETLFMAQQASIKTLEEHVSFENDGKALQPDDDSAAVNHNTSVFQESEKPTQELVIQHINTHSSLSSQSLGNVDASKNVLSTHNSIPTSGTHFPYSSMGQNPMSNVAAAPNQAELPIKLQFGLFSGPSLIPSPVPAIQIGSIRMPLPLHAQVGSPLSHVHPSQPPLFQFGQLRYTSPISQGIMPMGPQSMSFVQHNIPSDYSFNHKPGGHMPVHSGSGTSDCFIKNGMRPCSVDNQPGYSRHLSQGSRPSENAENVDVIKHGVTGTATGFQVDKQGSQIFVGKNSTTAFNANKSEGLNHARDASLHSISEEKDVMESKPQFPVPGGRGKKYIFTVKTPGSRSSGSLRVNRADSRRLLRKPRWNNQHTEFRVRDSDDKRQSSSLVLSDQFGSDNKSNISGRGTGICGRTRPRKTLANKLGKQTVESATENFQQIDSGSRAAKITDGKESINSLSISHSGHSNHKRNLCSEEGVDAPLQSGIICVFEQPGIEAPSDEDDFIEVRSKRQMLNDRREQREKEIKAKCRVAKMQRKPCSNLQNAVAIANSSKEWLSTEVATGDHPHLVAAGGHGITKVDVSSRFSSSVSSQLLAPIGTPPLKIDAQPDLTSLTNRSLQISGGGKGCEPGVLFESNKVDNVQALGSWGNVPISQQVMALTQTQLDEAMKPQEFDSQASIGDLASAVKEPSLPSLSILTKEKAFTSTSSPINSLLAGEKIQFGAVTTPTVLPFSNRPMSHGIGPSQSSRSDMQISHNLDGSSNDCNLFFDEKKHINESCGQLEDCEAEAEAAASAVAAAAISSDEIVGNGLGTCAVSVSDAKSFVAAGIDGITAGVSSEQQLDIQSRSKEPLSVSLPIDLSLETPPISLWPPIPNQQNSSNQIVSHFPGGTSHFPFYEMGPMMGGPVFAFGPHDESASTAQSQPLKCTTSASRPIGSWHQCHAGVDSFYGPPTGFAGPFITPPGGIPGVQGPPPMVVYNHFAPVGQFGQVGLSLMGTTYIPPGKQPDWKHNPPSSATGAGEVDMNMNMASSQRNAPNMPSPIQHLAPGSPLLPMASPLPMFDVSPFQSTEMSVQARWPHVHSSQVPSIPQSMPSHQGVHTSQYSNGPVDPPLNVNRFTASQTSTSDVNVNHLPDELGLVDHSNSTAAKLSAHSIVSNTPQQNSVPTQQQHDQSSGYTTNYQKGGSISLRNSSGGEWSHRRMGFQGRKQSLGADKSLSSSKVKQIYVAKQTLSGASTVS
ncbi:uncharacterized protein LOC113868393 isoform X2 [Abrus precatorius]|uniref:Uncharacterized protein LOC113868393 isoform X2 n=1 Tax=Abrus precatorius TaxID=3816 RepID=A0A8B8LVY5_ABRPR|nr:uncharacterized protein LOC113868393 isoform X2 [Abrus precatorius]